MGDNPKPSGDSGVDDAGTRIRPISRRDALKYAGVLVGTPLLNSTVGHGKSVPVRAATAESVIEVDSDDTIDEIVEKAANVSPTPRQREWQELERTAFIHFGVNTFTGREWGTGLEDPDIFQPTDLDPEQWMAALKDGGFELVILTAKHHDGFCLWPSKYTDHDVGSSSWRDGEGDVVREVAAAAHGAGLKFGVYLSPADLHELEASGGRYDNGSEPTPSEIPTPVEGEEIDANRNFTYTVDDYNRYFLNQLYELLTEYGPIDEVWFDGANPEPGTDQTYNETVWFDLVRELHPDSVIAVGGPDARWVGNEEGVARKSEWSPLPFSNEDPSLRHRGTNQVASDLGSREQLAQDPNYLAWYPAEADTSIRPGWFYHEEEDDQVMSVEELIETYYKSVGRNANLLLNLPPDQRGRLHDTDVERVAEFGERISETFDTNLAQGASVSDSSPGKDRGRFGADNAVDGDADTYWQPRPKSSTGELIFDLGEPKRFNCILLQECLDVGQRIESFSLDVWDGASWQETASGTTVGYKRLLRTDTLEARKIRLRITRSRSAPTLASFGLYHHRRQSSDAS